MTETLIIITNAQHRYLPTVDVTPDTKRGMIALGLEMETTARTSERFGHLFSDSQLAHHVADELRALLKRVGIYDDVIDEYSRMVNALHPSPSVSPVSSLLDISRVSQPGAVLHTAADSPTSDPPQAQLSFDSASSLPSADKNPPQLAPHALHERAIGSPGIAANEAYRPHEQSSGDRGQYDADAGTMGEE